MLPVSSRRTNWANHFVAGVPLHPAAEAYTDGWTARHRASMYRHLHRVRARFSTYAVIISPFSPRFRPARIRTAKKFLTRSGNGGRWHSGHDATMQLVDDSVTHHIVVMVGDF